MTTEVNEMNTQADAKWASLAFTRIIAVLERPDISDDTARRLVLAVARASVNRLRSEGGICRIGGVLAGMAGEWANQEGEERR